MEEIDIVIGDKIFKNGVHPDLFEYIKSDKYKGKQTKLTTRGDVIPVEDIKLDVMEYFSNEIYYHLETLIRKHKSIPGIINQEGLSFNKWETDGNGLIFIKLNLHSEDFRDGNGLEFTGFTIDPHIF